MFYTFRCNENSSEKKKFRRKEVKWDKELQQFSKGSAARQAADVYSVKLRNFRWDRSKEGLIHE